MGQDWWNEDREIFETYTKKVDDLFNDIKLSKQYRAEEHMIKAILNYLLDNYKEEFIGRIKYFLGIK